MVLGIGVVDLFGLLFIGIFWPALDRQCAGYAARSTIVLGDRDAATATPQAVDRGITPVGASRDSVGGGADFGDAGV